MCQGKCMCLASRHQSKEMIEGEDFVMYSTQPIQHEHQCQCTRRTTNALLPLNHKE